MMDLNVIAMSDFAQKQAAWYKETRQALLKSITAKLCRPSPQSAEIESGTNFILEAIAGVGVALELCYEQAPPVNLGVEIENAAGRYLNLTSGLSILTGMEQLSTVIKGETHRPMVTTAQGTLNVTRGVVLSTLIILSLLNPPVAAAIASTMACLSSVESYWHAHRRHDDVGFWLHDNLSQWMQLEKKITALSHKLESSKAQHQAHHKAISQSWRQALREKQKEHLARMKLDCFILKKDITCAIKYHLSVNEEVKKIQNILHVVQEKSSKETHACKEPITGLLKKWASIRSGCSIEEQEKEAKEIIGTFDQEIKNKTKKYQSKIKEVERYNSPAPLYFITEYTQEIRSKNGLHLQQTRHKLRICALEMVGAMLLATAINPVLGGAILGIAAVLFLYLHKKTIVNTVNSAVSVITNKACSFFSGRGALKGDTKTSTPHQIFAKK